MHDTPPVILITFQRATDEGCRKSLDDRAGIDSRGGVRVWVQPVYNKGLLLKASAG